MASLSAFAKKNGVKYFLVSFVDLFGTMRAKIVPATAIDAIAKAGAGFAGFAVWFDMTPAHPDILVMADADSAIQLPWKPEVAWVTGDLIMDGKPVDQNPRQLLKRVVNEAAQAGYDLKIGVECEYFLIQPDGKTISDGADTQAKPCYDQASADAALRRYRRNMRQHDHARLAAVSERSRGCKWSVRGMNSKYDSALKTADRHAFFKYMVKSIAERHGLRATFMPKPFPHLTGNGCHTHLSLWSSKTGKNMFTDPRGGAGTLDHSLQFPRRHHALG